MHEGGADIVVAAVDMLVVGAMSMMVLVVRVRVVALEQQPGARQIDAEAEHGEPDRLLEVDGDRLHQPHHGLVADRRRDQSQAHRAGEGRQLTELAGAEGKARVAGVLARKAIGEGGDAERAGMRRHVPTVRHHRHRAEQVTADDLRHHHHGGERDHEPGALFVGIVLGAEKYVAVLPGLDRMGVHGTPLICTARAALCSTHNV